MTSEPQGSLRDRLDQKRLDDSYVDGSGQRIEVDRREVRLSVEYLYDYKSPVGYFAIPHVVGGTGSIFHANLELYF